MDPVLFVLVYFFAYTITFIVPVARIFKRVGLNPWLAILTVIPLVNLFGLWFFAFSPWPSDSAKDRQEEDWSEADKEKFRHLMR